MNKEAKIGLTIILVLLITFVAVLAKRLCSSYAAGESLATEDKDVGKSVESADTNRESSVKADKAKTASASTSQPTVIAATSVSKKPPRAAANYNDQWSTASDSGGARNSAGSASALKSPPSYMPEPPKPETQDRYARYQTAGNSNSSRPRRQDTKVDLSDAGDTMRRYSSPPESSDRYTSVNSPARDSTDYRSDSRYNRNSASASAVRKYTVAEGDSLFDIARCELGKASRWAEIYDLNVNVLGKDIESLVPGTQIVLPDDSANRAIR